MSICFELDPTSKKKKPLKIVWEGDRKNTLYISGISPSDFSPDKIDLQNDVHEKDTHSVLAQLAFEKFLLTNPDPAESLHVLS